MRVVGVGGFFRMPSDVFIGTSQPKPHLYIGFSQDSQTAHNQAVEVDAGLEFNPEMTANGIYYPDRWKPFLRINDGKHPGYTDLTPDVGPYYRQIDAGIDYVPVGSPFVPADYVSMELRYNPQSSLCTILVQASQYSYFADGASYMQHIFCAPVSPWIWSLVPNGAGNDYLHMVKGSAIHAKYVVSLDNQPVSTTDPGITATDPVSEGVTKNYKADGSYLQNVFFSGMLLTSGGLSTPWTTSLINNYSPTSIVSNMSDWYFSPNLVGLYPAPNGNPYGETVNIHN